MVVPYFVFNAAFASFRVFLLKTPKLFIFYFLGCLWCTIKSLHARTTPTSQKAKCHLYLLCIIKYKVNIAAGSQAVMLHYNNTGLLGLGKK